MKKPYTSKYASESLIDRLMRIWTMQQRWAVSVKEIQRNPQYAELNDERNDVHEKLNTLTFTERRQLLWDSWSKTLTFVQAKSSGLKKIQDQTPKASTEEFKAAFDMYYEAQSHLETFFDTIFDADTMPLFFTPGECAVRDVLTKDQWMMTHLVEKTETSFLEQPQVVNPNALEL